MVSAWEIYWVMQLDNIGSAFSFIGISGGLAAVVLLFLACMNRSLALQYPSISEKEEALYPMQFVLFRRALMIAAPAFLLAAFIPSSKTAAAMIVIPAIANNETIQREAGDLYKIAKEGLRDLVTVEPQKAEK